VCQTISYIIGRYFFGQMHKAHQHYRMLLREIEVKMKGGFELVLPLICLLDCTYPYFIRLCSFAKLVWQQRRKLLLGSDARS
jgi:hypothetical protein